MDDRPSPALAFGLSASPRGHACRHSGPQSSPPTQRDTPVAPMRRGRAIRSTGGAQPLAFQWWFGIGRAPSLLLGQVLMLTYELSQKGEISASSPRRGRTWCHCCLSSAGRPPRPRKRQGARRLASVRGNSLGPHSFESPPVGRWSMVSTSLAPARRATQDSPSSSIASA